MKILHVNHLLDPVSGGGTAERTFQLSRFLNKQGSETAILTLDIGDTTTLEQRLGGIPVIKLPCINRRYYILLTLPSRIYRLISKFDVVHLMGHWTLVNALIAITCLLQRKPYVICPAGSLKSFGRSTRLKKIYDCIIGKYIIRKASACIAITEDEKKDFSIYGIDPGTIIVIPNGIDPDQYALTDNANEYSNDLYKLLSNTDYILYLGRMNKIKGPDLLLDAFVCIADQNPDLHLVLAGPDSGLLQKLQDEVIKHGYKSRVHFTGYLGGNNKTYAIHKARCLIIPSREEAMSMVVLEAGICGTPVIFTDRCGLEEFNQAGAGIMVEPETKSIINGLKYAISNYDAVLEKGKRLKSIIVEKYLWDVQADRYLALYREILDL